MARVTIDKSSRVPYYDQLREILENAMRSGELPVGEQLPSQAALCEDVVSRTDVWQALNELANEGLIMRYRGKGSFVAPPKVDRQHCAVHRVRNLLAKLPERERERSAYWQALDDAVNERDGKRRLQRLVDELEHAGYTAAAKCLADDLDALVVDLRYPTRHPRRWRSTDENVKRASGSPRPVWGDGSVARLVQRPSDRLDRVRIGCRAAGPAVFGVGGLSSRSDAGLAVGVSER